MRRLLRWAQTTFLAVAYVVYQFTVCAGFCVLLTILPAWVAWHTTAAVGSLLWHLVGRDAVAIASALLHHDYRTRTPKDVAVSHLIHLTRQHSAVLNDLVYCQGRMAALEQAFTVRYRAPPSFLSGVRTGTSAWISLHSEAPSTRLAAAREVARFCSSSFRPPNPTSSAHPHLTRPALLSLGSSLLPTPLILLDSHLNSHGILSLPDFAPHLARLFLITLDLHYLSLAQSLTGGESMRPISGAECEGIEQGKALLAFAGSVEALEMDSVGRPCPELAMAGLKLIKMGARVEMLGREERRVDARREEGLLLLLCRWKEEKEGKRSGKWHCSRCW
ncbi:hypothetical protein BCR35DRAFT_305794 [Leucosporidium creatinivorum]|uniref:Uncharacterized protein n=1 Tax=Leucosporidium creatinivorum TaxID=106004 RepID=A0A1Y2EZK1_9BASI|nr:hypothetical protein BCR35DRAFT_305794 [Leucosporidium creatinivorum]